MPVVQTTGEYLEFNCLNRPTRLHSEEAKSAFRLCDRILELADDIPRMLQDKSIPVNEITNYRSILLSSFPKTINTFLALCQLCDQVLTEDAKSLVRKLLETSVSLMYINVDLKRKKERVNQFYHHGLVELHEMLQRVERYPDRFSEHIREGFSEIRDEIIKSYETAKQYFPTDESGDIKRKFKANWHGSNLNTLLMECGMKAELIPYRLFSGSTHFSIGDFSGTYYDFESNSLISGRNPDYIPHLLISGIDHVGQVLQFIDIEFGLQLDMMLYEIASESSKLKEAINQRLL